MASKALQSDELGEDEMQPAPKLLEVILQNCRGQVDECLPLYMQARPRTCTCLPYRAISSVTTVNICI